MNELVFRNANGVPMTTSHLVAETFGKEHNKVVRDIEKLECSSDFQSANFGVSFKIRELPNGGRKEERYYNITKDGFTFLAMGYTGKKAAEFKEKYIAAFNAMEQQIRQGVQLSTEFMQTQMQMMNQMMQLCNSMMTRIERLETAQQAPKPVKVRPSFLDNCITDSNYPHEGVLTTYRKLRELYPRYITVIQAAEELRRRDIGIRHPALYRYLRENGLISGRDGTYQRPSAECVKNGWMVCVCGRRVEGYPGRRYFTPYLSPEFVDILERQLSARRAKVMQLWKEVEL